MNETVIPPKLAAMLAEDVYTLVTQPSRELAILNLNKRYGRILEFVEDPIAKASSGCPFFIKTTTGFGIILKGNGILKGQGVMVFCGTKTLGDLITDLNFITTTSKGGRLVHDGFRSPLVQSIR